MILWRSNPVPPPGWPGPREWCNARQLDGSRCTNRRRPGELRCGVHRGQHPREPIGWQGGVPVLAATRVRSHSDQCDLLRIDCVFCGAEHIHGADGGDGHRAPHCLEPPPGASYIVREVREAAA